MKEDKLSITDVLNDKNLLNRDSYDLQKVIMSIDKNSQLELHSVVYDGDKLIIKTPHKQQIEDFLRIKKLQADQDEFEQLIKNECGKFYFNFYNGGLIGMDIKESIKARFLYLCTYTNYKEKGMYLTWDNGKRMTRKCIAEVLGLSEREFKTTIKTMLDNQLLTKDGDHFLVNQTIAIRGKLTTKQNSTEHTRVFDSGLRELYKNCKTTQHKQLYYLFRLLPYVNLKCNAICQNPTEQDVEQVIVLRLNQICEVVGYDTANANKFKREMLKLQLFGQYAMLGIINSNGVWWKVNPRIVYAGTSGHLEEFKELLATDFSVNK